MFSLSKRTNKQAKGFALTCMVINSTYSELQSSIIVDENEPDRAIDTPSTVLNKLFSKWMVTRM